jgi:hypothetical protein
MQILQIQYFKIDMDHFLSVLNRPTKYSLRTIKTYVDDDYLFCKCCLKLQKAGKIKRIIFPQASWEKTLTIGMAE